MIYRPDRWVVLKLNNIYKVFGTWRGSYLTGDSWRLNSGIVGVEKEDDFYIFKGYSSSLYYCHQNMYGSTSYGNGILDSWIEELDGTENRGEVLEDKEDWVYYWEKLNENIK